MAVITPLHQQSTRRNPILTAPVRLSGAKPWTLKHGGKFTGP